MVHFRHCYGGSRTTIINNNFYRVGMPMFRPMPRPMFFGGFNCCGGNSMWSMMAKFSIANMFMNNMSNLFGLGNNQNGYNSYNNTYSQSYNSNNSYGNNCNCPDYSSQLQSLNNRYEALENKFNSLQEQLKNDNGNKEITLDGNGNLNDKDASSLPAENKTEDKKSNASEQTDKKDVGNTESAAKKNNAQAAEDADDEDVIDNTEENLAEDEKVRTSTKNKTDIKKGDTNFDTSVNKILDALGTKDLNDTQKSYIKNHITDIYEDSDGKLRYNIKAVAHDTDSTAIIAGRFYQSGETPDLQVGKGKFNTQGSEKNSINEPYSGSTIIANGVSEYGLKALIQEAKDGITSQGEIAKTNKRITQLKSDFENGKQKLSWAYVSQNNLMSKYSYDKIIQEKYSAQ